MDYEGGMGFNRLTTSLKSLLHTRVHRQQRVLRSPIELLDVVPSEGVYFGCDGGGRAAAGKVKSSMSICGKGSG